jgi:hypothetical protein
MTHTQGGRGHKAPYDTKMARVPVPLSSQVAQLINQYHDFVANGGDPNNPSTFLASDKPVNNFESENQELRNKLSEALNKIEELQASKPVNSFESNLEKVRDRVLNKLKVGRQSTAGKAIDAFIREVKR